MTKYPIFYPLKGGHKVLVVSGLNANVVKVLGLMIQHSELEVFRIEGQGV